MDEAAAGEGDELGLLLRPPRQRQRPLARPTDLEDLLAGEDDAAVDDADDERRELSRRHGDHRLVEERESLANAARPHQHVALGVHASANEIAIAEALADRRRLARDRGRRAKSPSASCRKHAGSIR